MDLKNNAKLSWTNKMIETTQKRATLEKINLLQIDKSFSPEFITLRRVSDQSCCSLKILMPSKQACSRQLWSIEQILKVVYLLNNLYHIYKRVF